MRQCLQIALFVSGLLVVCPESAQADPRTFDLASTPHDVSRGARPELGFKDQQRAKHYLSVIDETGRAERISDGMSFAAIGGPYLASALGFYLAYPSGEENRVFGAVYGLIGVATLAISLYYFLTPSDEEEVNSEFNLRLQATNPNWDAVLIDTNSRLERLAATRRARRKLLGWVGAIVGALAAAAGVVSLIAAAQSESRDKRIFGYGMGAFSTGTGIGLSAIYILHAYQESPTERLVRLYREDPGLKLNLGISGPF